MSEYSKEPSYKETGLNSPITEFALALAGLKENSWYASGTAIVIAPYLAITAKHNIEDYWKLAEYQQLRETEPGDSIVERASFALVACQILDEGKSGVLWNITRLWLSPFSDIAFLRLTPSSERAANHKWRIPKMNLLPPDIGSRIVGFGYTESSVDIIETQNGIEVKWKDSPITTVGEVIEIHELRRERGTLKFPCFRTNARFGHGMSGGPVFNLSGELCGIISLGLEPSENHPEYISYAASLWPSMGTEIDMEREGITQGGSYPVLELAMQGYINAKGWERITIVKKPEERIHQVTLKTKTEL